MSSKVQTLSYNRLVIANTSQRLFSSRQLVGCQYRPTPPYCSTFALSGLRHLYPKLVHVVRTHCTPRSFLRFFLFWHKDILPSGTLQPDFCIWKCVGGRSLPLECNVKLSSEMHPQRWSFPHAVTAGGYERFALNDCTGVCQDEICFS